MLVVIRRILVKSRSSWYIALVGPVMNHCLPVRPWERKKQTPPWENFGWLDPQLKVSQDLQSRCHDYHWLYPIHIEIPINPDEDYIKMTVVCSTCSMTNMSFMSFIATLNVGHCCDREVGWQLPSRARPHRRFCWVWHGLASKHGEKTLSILDITTSLRSQRNNS